MRDLDHAETASNGHHLRYDDTLSRWGLYANDASSTLVPFASADTEVYYRPRLQSTMVSRYTPRNALLGRDVATAYAIIVALYVLKFVPFQPVGIPPYLLIVAYDLVEVVLPFLTPYYPIAFPLFLYVLAVSGAGITRRLRDTDSAHSSWLQTLGGVCLVIGLLSLGFGAFVGGPLVSPTDNPTPLAITGVTGFTFLGLAWWLLGRLNGRAITPA